MPDMTFNTTEGQAIAREQLVALLNVGTAQSPNLRPIGKSVGDSSVEYDWGEETNQDILGNVVTTMKSPIMTQTFDGVRLEAGDPAYEFLWNRGIKDHDPAALCNLDMYIAHLYAGTSATPFCEHHPSSSIRPTEIGGEGGGFLLMPFEATYGGKREVGTISKNAETGTYTFTAE